MAEQTKIEWVDHTFNPWIGCTRVSPACDNCYALPCRTAANGRASKLARRGGGRPLETGSNRCAGTARPRRRGGRAKVFGPSLADPFDAEVSPQWREDYLRLIEATPNLDWILLTKRPLVARKFFAGRKVPDNLWPGITAENLGDARPAGATPAGDRGQGARGFGRAAARDRSTSGATCPASAG
jgi:protein gp37